MSDYDAEYSEMELKDEEWDAIDQAGDNLPLEQAATEAEELLYRRLLTAATKAATGFGPRVWQTDATVAFHFGRDVFIMAGTGYGKTLAFVTNCFVDPTLLIWVISPLNALGNRQAALFSSWGLREIAVNATTNYKGLKKDILAGQFQVVISSIEAFTDTTRLLPIVRSPELAARGPQRVVIDEAHCILSWGRDFRPQYLVIGDLKLTLTNHMPFMAVTATANKMQIDAIKQSLRFGRNPLEIHLGNRRLNLAYSVYCLKSSTAPVPELLQFFPDTIQIDHVTLIFVDSKPLGHLALHLLRKHFAPELRPFIQLYHATRGKYDKEILDAGYEKPNGFKIMICTEAMALGVDFEIVTLLIQLLSR